MNIAKNYISHVAFTNDNTQTIILLSMVAWLPHDYLTHYSTSFIAPHIIFFYSSFSFSFFKRCFIVHCKSMSAQAFSYKSCSIWKVFLGLENAYNTYTETVSVKDLELHNGCASFCCFLLCSILFGAANYNFIQRRYTSTANILKYFMLFTFSSIQLFTGSPEFTQLSPSEMLSLFL